MPPKPVIDISASSAIDLKAQIAQQKEEFDRKRAGAKQGPAAPRRSDKKKPTVWARQNKGVSARQQRDEVQRIEDVEAHSLTRSREALERKAQLYEQLRKRRRDSDEDDDEEDILIDFDQKYWQDRELEERQRAQEKEKQRDKDEQGDEDDPWIEYEDEFGRTRIVRRSERPSSPESSPEPEDQPFIPRDPDQLADRASIRHYDASAEVRTRGVGFYQFATDDEQRAEQMERLNRLRQETEDARRNAQSAADRRKANMTQAAEKIKAKRAAMLAKRHKTAPMPANLDEDAVTQFLSSVRKTVEK
ncbi:hypothetical protein BCR43DRAFT_522936 [Syncephalastrum racemosum]|uniref:CCDC174 alpha/beta GRSR domain-containing protein n=1 Tax=Syncephalastrum racemosum TaxID=13706 RepID=A0A1X2HIH3_SYNRA|nr:hypothetical protein BCR43DRAFT_522936 [Syncephalastrum racemosum]